MRARRFFQGLGLAGALAFSGCSSMGFGAHETSWTMNSSKDVQAATGTVKVANQKDGNTSLKVEVEHLAPPTTVFQDTSTYVVWVKPENGKAMNVGVLKISGDLKGELQTSTAFKDFTVLVTAEHSPSVLTPSQNTVMNTTVTMPS
ncbi:MAG TPA: hypothetical protein VHG72_19420 [Polyangia bacterium]|nr:hypothetical protein [Polyangia bacterium]